MRIKQHSDAVGASCIGQASERSPDGGGAKAQLHLSPIPPSVIGRIYHAAGGREERGSGPNHLGLEPVTLASLQNNILPNPSLSTDL